MKILALLLFFFSFLIQAQTFRKLFQSLPKEDIQNPVKEKIVDYEIKYFDQVLDHFNYANQTIFKMRYLENRKFWNKTAKGIIKSKN